MKKKDLLIIGNILSRLIKQNINKIELKFLLVYNYYCIQNEYETLIILLDKKIQDVYKIAVRDFFKKRKEIDYIKISRIKKERILQQYESELYNKYNLVNQDKNLNKLLNNILMEDVECTDNFINFKKIKLSYFSDTTTSTQDLLDLLHYNILELDNKNY